jgi:ATP-binding cassette, subfamily F, member 3
MAVLLQVNNLAKAYNLKPVFSGLTLTVATGQHIGVIGRNGAGKSTLFKIIMGLETADAGEIKIHPNTNIGYIRQQENPFEPTENVIEFLMRSSGKEEWECAKMAGLFDIKNEQLRQEIGSFAGGYQMRVKIVAVLLDDPNLLLLDEPTNYLDLSTLLLLERFLVNYVGSFLLISHDREFLKRTCKQTLEITQERTKYFPKPLEEYLVYKSQQDEFAKRYNKKIANQQRHLQSFVDRFRYKASKASQAQSKIKQIDKLQAITLSMPAGSARISIPRVSDRKGMAVSVDKMSMGYGETIVASEIDFQIERGEHIAIVGNNGQGKTTLLKTLAGVIPTLSGSYKFGTHMHIGYYAQHVPEMLNPKDQVQSHLEHMAGGNISAQDIYKMAGNFLFKDDDLKKPVSVLSGGEKARLSLAGLLLQKNHLLLLDEPTNHLDFETIEALSEALAESNTTIIFVSHNRTFVNTIASSIIEVANGKVHRSYHNYENYVYHLKKELHIEEKKAVERAAVPEKKAKRIDMNADLKQAKKDLRAIELTSMELEREKLKLLSWFEKNTGTFSREKQDGLKYTEEKLAAAELEWFKIQEEIEELEVLRKELT